LFGVTNIKVTKYVSPAGEEEKKLREIDEMSSWLKSKYAERASTLTGTYVKAGFRRIQTTANSFLSLPTGTTVSSVDRTNYEHVSAVRLVGSKKSRYH
jgi:hypothetical protein